MINQKKINVFYLLDEFSIRHNVNFNAVEALHVQDVYEMVKEINSLIPTMQYQEGNPNNGKPFHTFDIGKEFSRVVYINVVKAYRKDIDYQELKTNLLRIGSKYGADENYLEQDDDGILIWRFWWD